MKSFILLPCFLFISFVIQAQNPIIRGRISEAANNTPIAGATISVKNSSASTSTDSAGLFAISAKANDILEVTSIGYEKQSIPVANSPFIEVRLTSSSLQLSEVVVTALGIKKEKAKLGYAVQDIKGENLIKAREPNLVNSLTGRVAGLQITNSTDLFQDPGISLRGRKPLIVIDGIPDQTADMWKINADDVESITVLKGSAASALYGSIGQNGAIMVTTKRGGGKQLSIDINTSVLFQTGFIRIPKVQSTYGNGNQGSYEYIDGSGGGSEGAGDNNNMIG